MPLPNVEIQTVISFSMLNYCNDTCSSTSWNSPLCGMCSKIVDKACKEAEMYVKNNVDGIIVENMHDVPYIKSKHFEPETVAIMTKICTEVRKIVPRDIPCGVQVLTTGSMEAIAIAKACSFNFIRSEGFVFAHIGDEGYIESNAGLLLRYRKKIDAEDILIFTDVKKKHSSHSITNDVSLVDTAKAAEFFSSDGLILTGFVTGQPASLKELQDLKDNCHLPIIIGSGVTSFNLKDYLKADALVVGSHFKEQGNWFNNIEESRIKIFMETFAKLRN